MKPKVMLDIDGVLANFYKGFAEFLNKNYNCTLNPKTDPDIYEFEGWGQGTEILDFKKIGLEWAKSNGFRNLQPFENLKEFIDDINSIADVYIVTARIGDWDQIFSEKEKQNIKQNTIDWLNEYEIPTNKVFFIHNKILFCKDNDIGYMIEDKLSTAINAAKENIHTILINRGYNKSKIDRLKVYRVNGLLEAASQLRKLINAKKKI